MTKKRRSNSSGSKESFAALNCSHRMSMAAVSRLFPGVDERPLMIDLPHDIPLVWLRYRFDERFDVGRYFVPTSNRQFQGGF